MNEVLRTIQARTRTIRKSRRDGRRAKFANLEPFLRSRYFAPGPFYDTYISILSTRNMCIYTYIHIYTYIYVYIHIYIHILFSPLFVRYQSTTYDSKTETVYRETREIYLLYLLLNFDLFAARYAKLLI